MGVMSRVTSSVEGVAPVASRDVVTDPVMVSPPSMTACVVEVYSRPLTGKVVPALRPDGILPWTWPTYEIRPRVGTLQLNGKLPLSAPARPAARPPPTPVTTVPTRRAASNGRHRRLCAPEILDPMIALPA